MRGAADPEDGGATAGMPAGTAEDGGSETSEGRVAGLLNSGGIAADGAGVRPPEKRLPVVEPYRESFVVETAAGGVDQLLAPRASATRVPAGSAAAVPAAAPNAEAVSGACGAGELPYGPTWGVIDERPVCGPPAVATCAGAVGRDSGVVGTAGCEP